MSLGLRADPTNTSAVISVAGTDQVVITNTGNVTANTFTGTLAGNADTATKFASTVGAPPVYGCRAWVNFDGTKNVSGVTDLSNTNRFIRGSGNVSNVVRNAVGDYTIVFAIAMPDANYCATTGWTTANPSVTFDGVCAIYSPETMFASQVRIFTSQNSTTPVGEDSTYVGVAIFR
jgi:hypothetical protein